MPRIAVRNRFVLKRAFTTKIRINEINTPIDTKMDTQRNSIFEISLKRLTQAHS